MLFTEVMLVAAEAGLAPLGTIAIDGTKIPANAWIDANRAPIFRAQRRAVRTCD